MRTTFLLLTGAALLPVSLASAQMGEAPRAEGNASTAAQCDNVPGTMRERCLLKAKRAAAKAADAPAAATPDCSTFNGAERTTCLNNAKKAAESGGGGKGTKGVSKADANLVNSTNAAAQAKLNANDFAGAAAEYQKGIDASPNNPVKHILYAGLAMAQRRQAVAVYNSGTRPTPPPPGSSNETVRAFNTAVATAQTERNAATLPLLRKAIATAATAAQQADASSNKSADAAIGSELREDAALLFRLDTRNVLTVARPSATLEADWLKRWLAATNPLAESLAAKYGMATAAALTAQDKTAGLALADEVKGRSGNDADGAMGYAEIVVAARTPVGDPHRAQATAWLTAVEANVIDGQQKRRLGELKTALAAAS